MHAHEHAHVRRCQSIVRSILVAAAEGQDEPRLHAIIWFGGSKAEQISPDQRQEVTTPPPHAYSCKVPGAVSGNKATAAATKALRDSLGWAGRYPGVLGRERDATGAAVGVKTADQALKGCRKARVKGGSSGPAARYCCPNITSSLASAPVAPFRPAHTV